MNTTTPTNMNPALQQDECTVLATADGKRPERERLSSFFGPPRYEELEDRMVYAAGRQLEPSINGGVNPLIRAATPLLSTLAGLQGSGDADGLRALKDQLVAELKHFEAVSLNDQIDHSQVLAARYVLCTVADEAVLRNEWGDQSDWSSSSLLSIFHNETSGGEKFFRLLDHLGKDPVRHLDLIELMYVCLALGFTGKFGRDPRDRAELDATREGLFRQVRQLRGEVPRELSPRWEGLTAKRQALIRVVPWWLVAAGTLVCLVVMYSGFAQVLSAKREAVLKLYQPARPVVAEQRL